MPLEHHRLQEAADSCVAAAVRVLASRSGVALDERTVRGALGPPPRTLRAGAAYGTYEYLDIDEPSDLSVLLATLAAAWCAVTVCGGPAAARAARAGLRSPHGALAVPRPGVALEDVGVPHHVIVLVGFVERNSTLVYLDPFFPADGQPLDVPLAEFVARWWTGAVLTWG